MNLEDRNYYSDPRTNVHRWYNSFDSKAMTVTVTVYFDDEGGDNYDCEEEVTLPVRYEVCDLCDGKGSHVNPSIDCGGLTAEDFDEDPGFAEAYFNGGYDQPCNQCGGRRVVPVVDSGSCDPETLARFNDHMNLEAEMAAEDAYNRRWGC